MYKAPALCKVYVSFLNLSHRAVPEKSDHHVFLLCTTPSAITVLYSLEWTARLNDSMRLCFGTVHHIIMWHHVFYCYYTGAFQQMLHSA
jgi:hypothetical protein